MPMLFNAIWQSKARARQDMYRCHTKRESRNGHVSHLKDNGVKAMGKNPIADGDPEDGEMTPLPDAADAATPAATTE